MARTITPQQMLFAVNVASGMTAKAAAIDAGYAPKYADRQGSQLLVNPRVKHEIDRIKNKATAASLGSKAEALDILWQTAAEARADGDRVNVTRCLELWLKATGQLVTRQQIETNQQIDLAWTKPIMDDAQAEDDDHAG